MGHPLDIVERYRAHHQTPNTVLISYHAPTHMSCDVPRINAMQLYLCTLCHVPCTMITIRTSYTVHYTVYHGQFMSNAHNCHKSYKHVNISNLAYINKNHPCNHHASCIIITHDYDFHTSINHGQLSYLA